MPPPTITIESVQNPRIKHALRLRDAGARRQTGQFLIDGDREIALAQRHGIELEVVYVAAGQSPSAHRSAATALHQFANVPLQPVSPAVLGKLSYGQRGAESVAVAKTPQTTLSSFQWQASQLLLVLDQTEKPGNLGACLRTASACGVAAVILTDPVCEAYNPNAIRASRGTIFSLDLLIGTREEFLACAQAQRIPLFSARVDARHVLWQQDFTSGGAVVFGSEALGLGSQWELPEVRPFTIPMQGVTDSLNLSISTAVTLYEALRQRQKV